MNRNKKIIAITGVIGSGKSTVCRILREAGEICLNCDKINSDLLQNAEYLSGLQRLFPEAFTDGIFRKEILRSIIFEKEEERQKLNRYAHAKIKEELVKEIETTEKDRVFVEIPILNQTGFEPLFDEIWVVRSSEENKIQRLKERDGSKSDLIKRQLQAQKEYVSDKKKTIYIDNDGSIEDLRIKIINMIS